MSKIKQVVRVGLPETNSSSSHSVVISMDPSGIVPKEEWGLNIDEDLILRIPEFYSFGRSNFKSNKVLTKLQYLSCYFMRGYYANIPTFKKKAHKFKQVIKDILGVRAVIFENFIEEEDGHYFVDFPEVDHESNCIFSEILESEDTLKNFLLNRNTWIYGGSDGFRDSKVYYLDTEEEDKKIGCLSCYLGGEIGRVDIELSENLKSYLFLGEQLDDLAFLGNFYYDFDKEKFIINPGNTIGSYQGPYLIDVESRDLVINIIEETISAIKSPRVFNRVFKLKSEFKLYEYDVFEI